MGKINAAIIAALFMILTAFSASFADFKNYAIALDTGYTITALFYGGYGVGAEGEICFLGNFSAFLEMGYQNELYYDIGYDTQLFYGAAGIRFYLSYDALEGPWLGIGVGLLDADYSAMYIYPNLIFPFEGGYKFILEKSTGFFIEPEFKLMISPYIDYSIGLVASYTYMIGFNVGFAF